MTIESLKKEIKALIKEYELTSGRTVINIRSENKIPTIEGAGIKDIIIDSVQFSGLPIHG